MWRIEVLYLQGVLGYPQGIRNHHQQEIVAPETVEDHWNYKSGLVDKTTETIWRHT